MSIYDKASLVHIPSGYKSGTLYNVLPNDADGDFDFTRASTATRVNKDGLIETVASGVPRLDYPLLDGVVQDCPTLLLEPQRTNSVPYSNDFNQHSISGGSITSDNITSPDGSVNSDTFVEDTANSQHRIREDISVSAGTYTMSVFVKGTDRFISLYPQSAGSAYAVFDIENAAITKTGGSDYVDSKIEDYGNGWYRCILTYDVSAGTSFLHIYLSDKGTGTSAEAPTYTGNGSEMSFYGLQLEAGSYPTSYIPTSGATITRSADVCNGAEADFNDSEGVLYANIAALAQTGRIALNDGTTSNNVRFVYNSGTNRIDAILFNGSNQASLQYTLPTEGLFNKIAFKYKPSDFALYVDGFEVVSQTGSGTTFPSGTLSELDFDAGSSGLVPFYGKTKEVIAFNEALSDTELEALTSYDSFNEMATEQLYTLK